MTLALCQLLAPILQSLQKLFPLPGMFFELHMTDYLL